MDELKRHWAESQWIIAVRLLCLLQYPVMYLSLFWSNSSNLALIFYTHIEKKYNLQLFKIWRPNLTHIYIYILKIFGNQKIEKIIKKKYKNT